MNEEADKEADERAKGGCDDGCNERASEGADGETGEALIVELRIRAEIAASVIYTSSDQSSWSRHARIY